MIDRVSASLLALALAGLVAAPGCSHLGLGGSGDRLVPGETTEATVNSYQWRGDYLDVGLQTAGFDFRFFFPASPECKTLFEEGEVVSFLQEGRIGRVVGTDGATCDAIGVLTLRTWLDHGPVKVDERSADPEVVRFTVTDQDADLFLAVGSFGLASAAGWEDPNGAILVMPNRGSGCRLINVFATATLEFHPGAAEPVVMTRDTQRCAALGFTERYRRDPVRD